MLCGHRGCSLPEVSIISFLPLQVIYLELIKIMIMMMMMMMMMMMIKGTKIISGHLIPAHQMSHCVSITKADRLMLFTEIIAVYFKGHTKHVYTLGRQNRKL